MAISPARVTSILAIMHYQSHEFKHKMQLIILRLVSRFIKGDVFFKSKQRGRKSRDANT